MPALRIVTALVLAGLGAAPPITQVRPMCAPFRVMSYNILESYDVPAEKWAKWSLRRDDFIRQLQTAKPAIIGMQEVTTVQKTDLQQGLPGYTFLGVAREDGHTGGEATNIAINEAVFEIQSSGTFWLSPTPDVPSKGWDAGYKRIATWGHLLRRGDERRLLVLNTHLDSNGRRARLEGARQIAAWLTANRKPDELVIMTGDFNSGDAGPPVALLTSPAVGLRDSRKITKSPPFGPQATYDGKSRIDFVLVDPGIEVQHYSVLSAHGHHGQVLSDHFPVVVDVTACAK